MMRIALLRDEHSAHPHFPDHFERVVCIRLQVRALRSRCPILGRYSKAPKRLTTLSSHMHARQVHLRTINELLAALGLSLHVCRTY